MKPYCCYICLERFSFNEFVHHPCLGPLWAEVAGTRLPHGYINEQR